MREEQRTQESAISKEQKNKVSETDREEEVENERKNPAHTAEFLLQHFPITNLWIKAEKVKARWIQTVLRYSSYSLIHESKRLRERWRTKEWAVREIERECEIHQTYIRVLFIYSCIHGLEKILSFISAKQLIPTFPHYNPYKLAACT